MDAKSLQAAANGNDGIWEEIQRELLQEGIGEDLLREKRTHIISRLLETLQEDQEPADEAIQMSDESDSERNAKKEEEELSDGMQTQLNVTVRPGTGAAQDQLYLELLELLGLESPKELDHLDPYFAAIKRSPSITDIVRVWSTPSVEFRGVLQKAVDDALVTDAVGSEQHLAAIEDLADYDLVQDELVLARENYETLVQYGCGGLFAHAHSRVRIVAACKSLCCLAYISAEDDLQDEACKHYWGAINLAKPNDDKSDVQILLIWASRSLVRMHLQDDRCSEAIQVLVKALTPRNGLRSKVIRLWQENRTLLLATYSELAYLYNRTGSHHDAASLVKTIVPDLNSGEALDLRLELCIANIGSITAEQATHVNVLQRGLLPFLESSRSTDPPFLRAAATVALNPMFLGVTIDSDCKQMLERSCQRFQNLGQQYAKEVLQIKFTLAVTNLDQTGDGVEANKVVQALLTPCIYLWGKNSFQSIWLHVVSGSLLYSTEDFTKALSVLDVALAFLEDVDSIGSELVKAYVYCMIGKSHLDQGKQGPGSEWLRRSALKWHQLAPHIPIAQRRVQFDHQALIRCNEVYCSYFMAKLYRYLPATDTFGYPLKTEELLYKGSPGMFVKSNVDREAFIKELPFEYRVWKLDYTTTRGQRWLVEQLIEVLSDHTCVIGMGPGSFRYLFLWSTRSFRYHMQQAVGEIQMYNAGGFWSGFKITAKTPRGSNKQHADYAKQKYVEFIVSCVKEKDKET